MSENKTVQDVLYLFPDKIPFRPKDGRPFIIVDYGCRDGGMSVPLFQHLIGNIDG